MRFLLEQVVPKLAAAVTTAAILIAADWLGSRIRERRR